MRQRHTFHYRFSWDISFGANGVTWLKGHSSEATRMDLVVLKDPKTLQRHGSKICTNLLFMRATKKERHTVFRHLILAKKCSLFRQHGSRSIRRPIPIEGDRL